jgi:hypothetical protein
MQTSVTPLTARSQSLVSVAMVALGFVALSPLVELVALRWPFTLGEVLWRYGTLVMLVSDMPHIIMVFGIIAVIGLLSGNRTAVRVSAIVFGVTAVIVVLVTPLFVLDFFQYKRFVAQRDVTAYKMVALKTLAIAIGSVVLSAWLTLRAWQASEAEGGASSRRKKGEGLVVGQPKDSAKLS